MSQKRHAQVLDQFNYYGSIRMLIKLSNTKGIEGDFPFSLKQLALENLVY